MPFSSPVITSTRTEAAEQIDGRIAVTEVHQGNAGDVEERRYIALPTDDLDDLLAVNAQLFLGRLVMKYGGS